MVVFQSLAQFFKILFCIFIFKCLIYRCLCGCSLLFPGVHPVQGTPGEIRFCYSTILLPSLIDRLAASNIFITIML